MRSTSFRVTYNKACYYAQLARAEDLPQPIDWYLPREAYEHYEVKAKVSGPESGDARGWARSFAEDALATSLREAPEIVAARLAEHARSDPTLAGLGRRREDSDR